MSVVHLWRGMPDTGGFEAWCSAEVQSGHAVDVDEINQVTCRICLGMASDFGGACLARLHALSGTAPEYGRAVEAMVRSLSNTGQLIPSGRYVVRECIPVGPSKDESEWNCPAHSNECAIRRRCTNKCGEMRSCLPPKKQP